ncbi:hypothetical protein [Rhizobium leguminosarum]|uniref:hypothetical protein n=1 Tax=Rhizobium leguminosarum TaxID=384 RepID=UPI003F9843BC
MLGDRHWPPVKISDLIRESRIKGSNGSNAKKLTIRLYGRGIVASSDRGGSEATNYYVRKAGQFAYSKLDCLNGAFGIIPPHLDGYETTLDLPTFDFVGEVDPSWFLKTVARPSFYGRFKFAAIGSRKANRVPTEEFLATRLSLPPLAEQRAIAEVLRALDAVIHETETVVKQLECTRTEIARSACSTPSEGSIITPLKDIIGSIDAGVSVGGELRPLNEGECGVLRTSSVSSGTFRPDQIKVIADRDLDRVSIKPKADRIIISRANTPDLVGASAYVGSDYENVYLSDKLWQIDVADQSRVCARWLALVLSSPRIRQLIRLRANGTSGSMQNISKSALLSMSIGVPPIAFQKAMGELANNLETRLVLELRALEQLRRTSDAAAQELLSGRLCLPGSIIAQHYDKAGQAA